MSGTWYPSSSPLWSSGKGVVHATKADEELTSFDSRMVGADDGRSCRWLKRLHMLQYLFWWKHTGADVQCDQKKIGNIYKSCPKMISQEKWMTLTHLQKLPKNVRDLHKLIASKGFYKLPKLQKIAQSGHTADVINNN